MQSSESLQKVTEEEMGSKAVLTSPLSLSLSLEGEDESDTTNYRAPNLLQRVLSLFTSIRPGSDLTRLQLPPMFNIPKSQLQCYGESIYCIGTDMLSKIDKSETSLNRLTSVIGWSISTLRPLAFGVAPYNPILGETHHASRDNLNVLLEQVSHHPPVTALHATDEKHNIEIIWCHSLQPKFYGTYIETEVQGKRELKLLNRDETYVMNSPKLVIRFLPFTGVDWLGNVSIQCEQSGFRAELCYRGNSFLPRPSIHRSVKGKIFSSSSSKPICEISGHWDRTVTVKDLSSGEKTIIYDAKEALSGLKSPIVKDPKGVVCSESSVVWGEVSEAILNRRWEKAREAKSVVEEKERELARERKSKGENWVPKHFKVSYTIESGWECVPNKNLVPPAPILVPI